MEKEHILAEIKRTAQENGGEPLGSVRFLEETGIQKADWYPHHWLRWTDAQVEAGFERNQFGRPAIDVLRLLQAIAEYARELGHFPIHGEFLRLHKRDKEFPGLKAIRKRLGNRPEMISKVLDYCRAGEGWDDVIDLCLSAQKTLEEPSNTREFHQKSQNPKNKLLNDIHRKILSWSPARRRNTEEAYKSELSSFLKQSFSSQKRNLEIREEKGDSLCDIAIGNQIGIEIKKTPGLSEYDRCFGQLARHLRSYKFVILVIFDVARQEQFDDFIQLVEQYFEDRVLVIK